MWWWWWLLPLSLLFLLWVAWRAPLDAAATMAAVRRAFPDPDWEPDASRTPELRPNSSGEVRDYYERTTDRDYHLLRWCVGSGMHTVLVAPPPVGAQGRGTRQPMLILAEVRAAAARIRGGGGGGRVLEVGCGRGHCSLLLAAAAPDVRFEGIDLVPRHVAAAVADARRAGLTNVTFRCADAAAPPNGDGGAYDVVFGCEALCHLDSLAKRRAFLANVRAWLRRPGGRLVILDAFRAPTFDTCPAPQREAMRCAEHAFHIAAMPTRDEWRRLGATEAGLASVARALDLTAEAVPFWTVAARLARIVLWFPTVVRWYCRSNPARRETARRLLGAATVVHALHDGAAAEYGLLVLTH